MPRTSTSDKNHRFLDLDSDLNEIFYSDGGHLMNRPPNGQGSLSSASTNSSLLEEATLRKGRRKHFPQSNGGTGSHFKKTPKVKAKTVGSVGGRYPDKGYNSDTSDDFVIDNEEIFQEVARKNSGPPKIGNSRDEALSNLPSARTLRGGVGVVARGRHETVGGRSESPAKHLLASVPGSASTWSLQSNPSSIGSDSRFDGSLGSVSPTSYSSSSPRKKNLNKINPGLKGDREGRRSRTKRDQSKETVRSISLSPQDRN